MKMDIIAVDMRGICQYDIFAENERINAARYLKSLKRLMDRWYDNRKYAVYLFNDNTRPHRRVSIANLLDSMS